MPVFFVVLPVPASHAIPCIAMQFPSCLWMGELLQTPSHQTSAQHKKKNAKIVETTLRAKNSSKIDILYSVNENLDKDLKNAANYGDTSMEGVCAGYTFLSVPNTFILKHGPCNPTLKIDKNRHVIACFMHGNTLDFTGMYLLIIYNWARCFRKLKKASTFSRSSTNKQWFSIT